MRLLLLVVSYVVHLKAWFAVYVCFFRAPPPFFFVFKTPTPLPRAELASVHVSQLSSPHVSSLLCATELIHCFPYPLLSCDCCSE